MRSVCIIALSIYTGETESDCTRYHFIDSPLVFSQGLATSNATKAAIFFCASWHEPSMQMAEGWGELIALHRGKGITFLAVEAEAAPNACER